MRIAHLCLASFYIDGFGYQENVLPRIHGEMGHDVLVIASTETYSSSMVLTHTAPGRYVGQDGVLVERICYVNWLPLFLKRKLRAYSGLLRILNNFGPDLVFVHDFQFFDSIALSFWLKNRPSVKCVVDTHTDGVNSATNFFSKFLHKTLYRLFAQVLVRVAGRVWATLPARKKFLVDIYGVPESKIDLLCFGADISRENLTSEFFRRSDIRFSFGLPANGKLIGLGGKIDRRKNIHEFLSIFNSRSNDAELSDIYLVIFGKPVPEMANLILPLLDSKRVIFLGWLSPEKIRSLIIALDVIAFPGTHSVLWEEAAGLGCPAVFLRREGYTHVDLGGNCILAENVEDCFNFSVRLVLDEKELQSMRSHALSIGAENFSYHTIARKSIDI